MPLSETRPTTRYHGGATVKNDALGKILGLASLPFFLAAAGRDLKTVKRNMP